MASETNSAVEAPSFSSGEALSLYMVTIVAMIFVASATTSLGIGAILLTQVTCIGGIPIIATRLRFPGRVARSLGITATSPRVIVGAILLGSGFWQVNLWLSAPFSEWFELPETELQQLNEIAVSAPYWLVILTMAVAPALCEEILVRGVIARALRKRLGVVGAVMASAALFALLHFSLIRLVPTALFGAVLAYIMFATGSILPGIISHFVNNAVALTLAVNRVPAANGLLETYPIATGIGTIICTMTGLSLLLRGKR